MCLERSIKQGASSSSDSSSSSETDSPESVVKHMQSMITPEIVEDIGKVFLFELSGDQPGTFYLDLKQGTAGKGTPKGKGCQNCY